jgi:predicted component of type VI protein secretion system
VTVIELETPEVDAVGDFWAAIRFICVKSELTSMEKIGILEVVKHELLGGLQTNFDLAGIDRI